MKEGCEGQKEMFDAGGREKPSWFSPPSSSSSCSHSSLGSKEDEMEVVALYGKPKYS